MLLQADGRGMNGDDLPKKDTGRYSTIAGPNNHEAKVVGLSDQATELCALHNSSLMKILLKHATVIEGRSK